MARPLLGTLATRSGGHVSDRDKYRDNDDVRDPMRDRAGVDPDTRSEARGDARENVGNTARGTDADPTGPEENDRTRHRPRSDEFDQDL
jgi:hypothetical protein